MRQCGVRLVGTDVSEHFAAPISRIILSLSWKGNGGTMGLWANQQDIFLSQSLLLLYYIIILYYYIIIILIQFYPRLAHPSSLKMEEICSSETPATFKRHILDDSDLHSHCHQDLKSPFKFVFLKLRDHISRPQEPSSRSGK